MGYSGARKVPTFVILVLRRLREWKEQKDRQVSSGADERISRVSKRYAPFAPVKRYTPFIHFWKNQLLKNAQRSPKRVEQQDLNPVFEG